MTINNYKLNGVQVLNKYLWSQIKTELGWSEADYGGLIPITVPSQQGEFNEYNRPYVVYNYSISGVDNLILQEDIAYVIYSSDEEDIRIFINLMVDLFNREDDSAREINKYVETGLHQPSKNFDFKWTRITSASGAQPPTEEGGIMDGVVMLRIRYIQSSDGAGRRNNSLFAS